MAPHIAARLLALLTLLCLAAGAHSATLLVANKSEASLSLFRLPGAELVATLPTGEGPHEVAVSPDGRQALVSNYGVPGRPGRSLTLIDVVQARVIGTIELVAGARPHGIEWLDNRRAVVTAEGLGSLLQVDTGMMAVTNVIGIRQDLAHMVAASAKRGLAFTANIGSDSATAIDLATGRKVTDLRAEAGTEGIALVRDDSELWLSNREAGSLSVFSTGELKPLAHIPLPGFPIRVEADDPRGRVYVTLPKTNELAVVNVETRQISNLLPFAIEPDRKRRTQFGNLAPESSMPIGVLLSGDGTTLFVAHGSAHVISVYDAQSLERLYLIPTGLEPDGMAWSVLAPGVGGK
jgi:DNA-binding beta-propeller fold protein YncE